jgi:hypothetical protein
MHLLIQKRTAEDLVSRFMPDGSQDENNFRNFTTMKPDFLLFVDTCCRQ